MEWWLVVALVAAGLKTAYSAFQKHLTVDYDGLELSYVTSVLGFVFMVPVGGYVLYGGEVTITPAVGAAILVSGVVNIGAIWAFLKALELEDLSVVAPLKQSTPIAVALAEPLVLVADYRFGVLAGAFAAVAGAYVLLSDDEGLATPLRRITETPALLALAAALLFAVASLANRFVTTQLSPYLYAFFVYAIMAVGFTVILGAGDRDLPARGLLRGRLLLLGGLTALRTSVTYVAFSLAIASRVSVVLQVSILLNVLAGGVLFAEEGLVRKLAGALLIVIGVVLTL